MVDLFDPLSTAQPVQSPEIRNIYVSGGGLCSSLTQLGLAGNTRAHGR
jgi:hypothetical protein